MSPKFLLVLSAVILWSVGVLASTVFLLKYAAEPSPMVTATEAWPSLSSLPFDTKKHNLVMFVHPMCPCSRASLWELERLVSKYPSELATTIVMVSDEGHREEWKESTIQWIAKQMPSINRYQDVTAEEASLFGMTSSGETLIYSPDGRRVFQGGLTVARGHMGEGPAQNSIFNILKRGETQPQTCDVFGCALVTAASQSVDP